MDWIDLRKEYDKPADLLADLLEDLVCIFEDNEEVEKAVREYFEENYGVR